MELETLTVEAAATVVPRDNRPAQVVWRRGRWVGWLCGCVALAALLTCPASVRSADEPAAEQRLGRLVRIELPVTGQTVDRVQRSVRRAIEKAKSEGKRLTLIFEFAVGKDQEAHGRASEFGASLALAELLTGEELAGVRTVAYVPQTIQGHAVLAVMACDELIMSKSAVLGPAGLDKKAVTESRRGSYRDIANRRKTIPAAVALWMLDPTLDVLVITTDVGREFILPEDLKALEEKHPVVRERKLFDRDNPEKSLTAEPGRFSGEEGRAAAIDLVRYLAESRQETAKALGLAADDLEEDLSLSGEWRAVRVDIKGPIRGDTVSAAQRMIDNEVRQRGANFICLWIDSPGGSLAESLSLANFLAKYQGTKVRTIAYIPSAARSDAALVATACQQVVMHPRAELGGPGASEFTREEIAQALVAIRDDEGPWRNRSWSQVGAMIDPRLDVFRCVRPGDEAWFCAQELEQYEKQHPAAARWQRMEQVTTPGQQYMINGTSAVERGLAFKTAESLGEFKALFGLEDDPSLLETGWAEFLIDALASPGVGVLLLFIGFMSLYIELHAPGVGIGGFVAFVCFVLFFWSHYLGGTAGWLEVSLFAAGVACLLLEIFVIPGFGIFGLGGGALVLASLILASQTSTSILPHNAWQFAELRRSLLTIAAAGVGFLAAAIILKRWLPRAPILGQVFLTPPEGEEANEIRRREATTDYQALVGKRGTTTTPLHPSGKARFGDRLVDVVSDGDAINRDEAVEVVAVQGNRVVVRADKMP